MHQVAINHVSSLIFHFQGHPRFYPVLPFSTQVLPNYPGLKLGKTVWGFYPPTLDLYNSFFPKKSYAGLIQLGLLIQPFS